MNTWYVIPARAGSKGFPGKNKKLVPIILNNLTTKELKNTIITTDDLDIIDLGVKKGCKIINRQKHLASDTANIKDVILNVIKTEKISSDDTIVMLYPTYPERRLNDINKALLFLNKNNLDSMLCRKKIKYPIPLIMESIDKIKGKKIQSKLYNRRQDWPEYFELCHFISIFKVNVINNLNHQLFNEDTGWMWIENKIDVDYENDWKAYLRKKNENK